VHGESRAVSDIGYLHVAKIDSRNSYSNRLLPRAIAAVLAAAAFAAFAAIAAAFAAFAATAAAFATFAATATAAAFATFAATATAAAFATFAATAAAFAALATFGRLRLLLTKLSAPDSLLFHLEEKY